MELTPGLTSEIEQTVEWQHTAAAVKSGLVAVLSTPQLIAWMEGASQQAVQPYLDEGLGTVGTLVNMRHLAATPMGMKVRVLAKLLEVDGRRLKFSVEAWDEVEKIGEGQHERFVIQQEKFLARVQEKGGSKDTSAG